mmetsp:Transcript_2937/g.9044  ORF Transcript_2937/g.9044 Transcript_2937/m.9044 type:complete len:208 (-) Transcript_2937:22-645(-)
MMLLAASSFVVSMPPPFPARFSKNSFDPLFAIVPKFFVSSSSLMPIPLSSIINFIDGDDDVPVSSSFSSTVDILILNSDSFSASVNPYRPASFIASCRLFSSASDAFDINSRKNTSFSWYKLFVTMSNKRAVSALNSCSFDAGVAAADESVFLAPTAAATLVSSQKRLWNLFSRIWGVAIVVVVLVVAPVVVVVVPNMVSRTTPVVE